MKTHSLAPRPPTSSRTARRRHLVLGAALALVAGLATVGSGTAQASAPTKPAAATPAYENAKLPVRARVADLLGRMTLAEKIGQMTQAERANLVNDTTALTDLGLGSVLSGGGSVPASNTPDGWADMVDGFQRQALQTRLKIPVLYGVDAVHGHNNLMGATVFPHNIGLGATRDPRLVERIAHITATETRASGPQWAFAPCLCVARDDRWGRTYESFSENPTLVSKMAVAIRGLQGRPGQLDHPDRVLATAKHFAGDGLTTYGTGSGDYPIDQGIDVISKRDFARLALAPYYPAISRYHVGSVMPSFSSVDWTEDGVGNPVKMTANRDLVTGVLKRQMGFEGLVISDWEAIHQLPGDWNTQVRTAVNAGMDMAMEPAKYREFITALTEEVEAGRVPVARIDDAVRRILTAKFDLGLFEHPFTDRSNIDTIGSPQHRAVARQAVAESQVLLKNRAGTLPLSRRAPLYVAGSNADNIGNQAGGWTITWQGGSYLDIPGSTILDGIRSTSRASRITVSTDASKPVPSDATGVVVVGETPYAEGFGDVGGPQWAWDPGDNGVPRPAKDMKFSAADSAAVDKVCTQAARCVVLVVSGRPLEIPAALRGKIDALVASWLPGSEGVGAADVLFGRKPFTGKLSFSWPKTVAQEPINVGDRSYDPLYPYGWGLRTRAH